MKTLTLSMTDQLWFKFKNKCRYYDMSMSDVTLELMLKFAETNDLNEIAGIPEHFLNENN